MCSNLDWDGFDAEDFANLAGFIETQLESEQVVQHPKEPSPDDLF